VRTLTNHIPSPSPLCPPQSLAIAEPLEGPTLQRYRQLAAATGLWLSVGGFQERGPDADHLYNCHVIISAAGDIVASYRKIHLFNVDVPGGPVLMESRCGVGWQLAAAWGGRQAGRQTGRASRLGSLRCRLRQSSKPHLASPLWCRFTAPGEALAACDSPAGRLGLSVCYDLRFPELYQRLAFDLGAQIMLIPSAFTVATGGWVGGWVGGWAGGRVGGWAGGVGGWVGGWVGGACCGQGGWAGLGWPVGLLAVVVR
jgi:hypothetical protein